MKKNAFKVILFELSIILTASFLFISCEEVLTIPNIEHEFIELIGPSDQSVITQSPIDFLWGQVQQAEQYRLQIFRTEGELLTDLIQDTLLSTNKFKDTLLINDNYLWRVRARNVGSVTSYSSAEFTLKLPNIGDEKLVLYTPDNDITVTDNNILFSWESSKFGSNYRIQIATPSFDSPQKYILDSLISNSQLRQSIPEYAVFQWRVRAEDSQGKSLFSMRTFKLEDPLVDKSIVLLSPSDNIELKNTTVLLNWDPLENVANYRVQVATPNFNSPEQFTLDTVTDMEQIEISLEDNTTYQWRVKGIGILSETNYTTQSFSVASQLDIKDQKVILVAPKKNAILNQAEVSLNWQKIEGAETYHIQIAQPSFSSPLQIVLDEEITSTQAMTTLQASTTYEWRVKAQNTRSETKYSQSIFRIN